MQVNSLRMRLTGCLKRGTTEYSNVFKRDNPKIGEILVEKGIISQSQLDTALKEKRNKT